MRSESLLKNSAEGQFPPFNARTATSFINKSISAELKELIRDNPVMLARLKASKAYQTESAKSRDDDQVEALIEVVKVRAQKGDIMGLRD